MYVCARTTEWYKREHIRRRFYIYFSREKRQYRKKIYPEKEKMTEIMEKNYLY